MVPMNNKLTNRLCTLMGVVLGTALVTCIARAQQPSPAPTPKKTTTTTQQPAPDQGEDAGNYVIISTIEVGARGLRVGGDVNKYRSDLNYHAGVRLFDSSFLMRSKDGKGGLFDTLLVTSSGWGADPNGSIRINVEKPKWYRFEGSYRRFKYFRYLNNFANPNWVFSPATFSVPPSPVTGYHGYNTRTQFGDFDLTILPKNERVRFTVGYSPERYSGPFFSTYHIGGNEVRSEEHTSELQSQSNIVCRLLLGKKKKKQTRDPQYPGRDLRRHQLGGRARAARIALRPEL